MSAEQLKAAVREYATENFGEVRSASVVINLGTGVSPEVLHAVMPASCEPARAESPSERDHIRLLETA